jgi:hypothetical protein
MDEAMSQDSSAAAAAAAVASFYSSSNVDDDTDDAALWASYYSVLWYAVLMSIVVMASKFLHDHAHDWIGALLPEAGLVILCGMIAGGMIHWYELYMESSSDAGSASASAVASLLNFSPDVFFVGLLPPIICTYHYLFACGRERMKDSSRHLTCPFLHCFATSMRPTSQFGLPFAPRALCPSLFAHLSLCHFGHGHFGRVHCRDALLGRCRIGMGFVIRG